MWLLSRMQAMKLIITAGDKCLYEKADAPLPYVWYVTGTAAGQINDNQKELGCFKNVRRAVEWATDQGYFGGE